jgi:hypothetical protein
MTIGDLCAEAFQKAGLLTIEEYVSCATSLRIGITFEKYKCLK